MKIQHLVFLLFIILISCGESDNSSSKKDAEVKSKTSNSSKDKIAENEEMNKNEKILQSENLYEFHGTIANAHKVFIQFKNKSKNKVEGIYIYTENNSLFHLKGTMEGNHVELHRMKNGEIRETFNFQIPENSTQIINGQWVKENKNNPLVLNYIHNSNTNSSSFYYSLQELIEFVAPKNQLADYSALKKLKIKDEKLLAEPSSKFEFNGEKILFKDQNDSGPSGHDDFAIFAYLPVESLPGENSGTTLLYLELQNSWDNTTEGEVNDQYAGYITVYNFEGGAQNELQSIPIKGEGYAQVYYLDEKVIIQSGEQKDIFYFNREQGRFVEH